MRICDLAKLGLLLGSGKGVEDARAAFGMAWAGEPMATGSWVHR